MNGANPDPTPPAREPDDVARLKLAQALQRAQYAIAWERVWPHLARLLTLTGLFLALSWAGLWLALPSLARAFALLLFAAAAIAALIPLARFRWPTREDGLGRLDRGTGIRHRPATELTDTVKTAIPSRWRCGRRSANARWPRSRGSAPACRRRGWRCTIPGRCARWSWC